jgi:DNA (cytosine-5)-methyltransferase 1
MKRTGKSTPKDDSDQRRLLVDLFSGAGGLSCGLSMAGFKSIAAVELEAAYANTFKENHPDSKVLTEDIRKLAKGDLEELLGIKKGRLDLLAAGIPCQGFSINAPIRTLDDPRNHLFKDYLTFIEKLKPKATIIENVTGIVSLGQGTVVEQIYKELEALGYSVSHRILYAAHYGVPQMRYRTIFIGVRKKGVKINFPEPTHEAYGAANFTKSRELCIKLDPLFARQLKPHTTIDQALSDLPEITPGEVKGPTPYRTKASNEFQRILRKDSRSVHNHHCARLSPINIERLKYIPQGGSWRDIPHSLLPKGMQAARRSDHTKRYGRLSPEGICSTILTKCDPHWGSYFHPHYDRVLSVREAARIQSFPDSYHFTGSIGDQYAQVGNAVPPLMAKAIGETVLSLMTANDL